MRKIICDRCGAEITGNRIGYVAAGWRAPSDNSFLNKNPYEHMDFCEDCMNSIVAFIDGVDIVREEPEAVEDPIEGEPETVEGAVEEEPEEDEEEDENALWEDEEKPEPKSEKKPVRKKGVNYTKLRELVKAGKTPKECADALGITAKQFYYARKRAEALYVAGRI